MSSGGARSVRGSVSGASAGWGLLDAGQVTLHDVKREILKAVRQERLTLDYGASGGDPAYSRPEGRPFCFFFDLAADGTDDAPDPGKKPGQPVPEADESVEPHSSAAVSAAMRRSRPRRFPSATDHARGSRPRPERSSPGCGQTCRTPGCSGPAPSPDPVTATRASLRSCFTAPLSRPGWTPRQRTVKHVARPQRDNDL